MGFTADLGVMILTLQRQANDMATPLLNALGKKAIPLDKYKPPKVTEAQKQLVLAYLRQHHVGRKNAQKNGFIGNMIGFRDVGSNGHRDSDNSNLVTHCAQELRKDGWPICGDVSGYFFPEDVADCIPTVLHEIKCALKYLKNAFDLLIAAERYFRMRLR